MIKWQMNSISDNPDRFDWTDPVPFISRYNDASSLTSSLHPTIIAYHLSVKWPSPFRINRCLLYIPPYAVSTPQMFPISPITRRPLSLWCHNSSSYTRPRLLSFLLLLISVLVVQTPGSLISISICVSFRASNQITLDSHTIRYPSYSYRLNMQVFHCPFPIQYPSYILSIHTKLRGSLISVCPLHLGHYDACPLHILCYFDYWWISLYLSNCTLLPPFPFSDVVLYHKDPSLSMSPCFIRIIG